ncbi:hypothetical protein BOX15_Mlig034294g1, partial [Macrostomum lignano]
PFTDCYGSENVTATKTGGVIKSHNDFGSSPYLNNMDCYWHVSVPVGQRIAFRFTHLNTTTNDTVTVFDGSNGSAVLLSTSGSFNGVIVSSANTATVWFKKNSVHRGYGFALWLQEVDNGVNNICGRIIFTNLSNGVIESHKGYNATSMSAYAPNLACLWTLPKRPGFYIYLFIETFYLSMGDCLKIVTKPSSTGNDPGSDEDLQYCSTYFGRNVHWVTTGDAQISFTTDNLYDSIGFSIQFYYEQACPSVQKWDSDNGEVVTHTNAGKTHYLNNMTCDLLISVSPDKTVIAWFTFSDMHSSDRFAIYDGVSGSPFYHGYYPPTETAVRSITSIMRFRFTTDASKHSYGLRMRYSIAENFCYHRKVLQARQGEFFDHNNSSSPNYLKRLFCEWIIIAPLGYSVVAQFTSFSLCSIDSVAMYDGLHRIHSPTIASFSGRFKLNSVKSRIIVSKSNTMLVYFTVSGPSTTCSGFGLKYNTTEKFCQGTELLTNDTGELASHSSAGIMASSFSSDCYWVIRVSPSKRVVARFTFYNLTSSSESVTLYDGTYHHSTRLTTLKSSFADINRYFISSKNVLTVQLQIKSYSQSLGIKMKYEASDAFCKGYKLITGGSGEISSHQGAVTLNYTSKMSCKWQFVGKPGIQISAKLIYLNLASYSYYNIFALYQGSDNTRLVTIRGGNSRWPTEFLTVSNILTVVFIARQPANELGFRLQYSFVDNVEPATTSLKQASSTTARAVVSSPSSPATAKIVSDTSSAPESTTTGKLSQTEPATTSSNEASSTTARAVVSSPSSPATAKIASDTSSAPESTTTENEESLPSYVLALAIAVPSAAIAINAAIVGIVIHKYLQNLKRLKSHTNSNTKTSDGPYAPGTASAENNEGSYWYLKADNVGNAAEKNPGEFEYDYICMKSRGDPQLNTSAAS